MRALIDATIHDTPIGQCVVLPPEPEQPFWWSWDDFTVGDVLAVVTSSSISDASPKWLRRGFVRVREVLPVVGGTDPYPGDNYITVGSHRWIVRWSVFSEPNYTNHDLSASPGDVVLVVEPWCRWVEDGPVGHDPGACADCGPTPVTVTHRDGVLGEIGDGSGDR